MRGANYHCYEIEDAVGALSGVATARVGATSVRDAAAATEAHPAGAGLGGAKHLLTSPAPAAGAPRLLRPVRLPCRRGVAALARGRRPHRGAAPAGRGGARRGCGRVWPRAALRHPAGRGRLPANHVGQDHARRHARRLSARSARPRVRRPRPRARQRAGVRIPRLLRRAAVGAETTAAAACVWPPLRAPPRPPAAACERPL